MTVYLLWNTYNEGQRLTDSMAVAAACLPGSVNLVCEGRYPMHDADEIRREFTPPPGIVLDFAYFAADEISKRNQLFRMADYHAQLGDWLVIMDADELLISCMGEELLAERLAGQRFGWVQYRRISDGKMYAQARVLRWEPGIEIRDRHKMYYRGNGELLVSMETPFDQRNVVAIGVHLDMEREPHRERAEAAYYQWLQETEHG